MAELLIHSMSEFSDIILADFSSIKLPCSMVRTPPLAARMIASGV